MKKILVLVCFSCAVMGSQAAYLWWQVTSAETADIGAYATKLKLDSSEVIGRVVAVDSAGERVKTSAEEVPFTDPWYVTRTSVNLDAFGASYQSYSYYVEFVNANDLSQTIGRNSKATTYENLAGSITSSNLPSVAPAVVNVWHGGSGGYSAAPEPTSAMLMLLGVAGLALRRKQRKLA